MKNRLFSEKYIEKVGRRNSVVYRCFTPDPAQAMIFGSGAAGGTMHTPDDSVYLLLGRCDNWTGNNRHGSIAGVRLRGSKGLFTRARSVRQVCDLFEARIYIYIDTGRGKLTIELTAIRGKDLVLLDISDKRSDPKPFTITLENWHTGDETSANDSLLRTVHINRDSVFNDYNRRVGLEPEDTKDIQDPLLGRAWGAFVKALGAQAAGNNSLELKANARQRILIALPGCAPASGVDTLADVEKQGKAWVEIPEAKLKSWLNEHEVYWKDFWSKSFIDLESGTGDAEYEERLWYVTQYSIACAAGGGMPPRFNGAHYLLNKDERSWDPEYVFQNMREVYWPLFAAGRWQFITEFFDLYFKTSDFVRRQTKKLFGLDGLIFREGFTIWGACVGINLREQDEKKRKNIFVSNYFSGNLELCLLMEWYYLASGDGKFLKEIFYPLLREILAAYRQYARKGADNKYHLEPDNAAETWSSVRDSMPDICGLRHFLPRALEWGKRFSASAELLSAWQEFYDNLAPVPVGRWTITRKYIDGIHDQEFMTAS
ncbi:MAG: DUF5703 domain-containing protein, partial [Verrucomicrobiota bacterium]